MRGQMISAPATLRVGSELNVSAVYLSPLEASVDPEGSEDFLLAVSGDANKLMAEGFQPRVSLENDATSVYWDSVELIGHKELTDTEKLLSGLGEQFSVIPQGPPVLLVFKFTIPSARRRKLAASNEFWITENPGIYSQRTVVIRSSPFAGVNSALFHGYTSQGTLSGIQSAALLLDARYLDGMEGGSVYIQLVASGLKKTRTGASIGIVVGSVTKVNGEGRLTVAVPWKVIRETAVHIAPGVAKYLEKAAKSGPRPVTDLRSSRWPGIAVVHTLLKGQRRAWGSGVLVAPDLVVTNNHVVQNALRIDVWLEKYAKIPAATVAHPLKGVDLVVLKLMAPVPPKFHPIPLAPEDPKQGDEVRSLGYGLFYPESRTQLRPLYSEGIVAAATPGMLVSSAGCWNGSSGGPLLDTSGRLLGIMASNARDDATGEIMPDMAFVIPVTVVREVLDNYKSGKLGDSSERFRTLWKLRSTHKDATAKL